MVKLMALYKQPRDPETFERIYFGEHVPLARKMPGLRRLEIDRITGAPRGEPDYYLVAHLYFDDAETMERSMASEDLLGNALHGRAGADKPREQRLERTFDRSARRFGLPIPRVAEIKPLAQHGT